MKDATTLRRAAGALLFLLGVIIGTVFVGYGALVDIEASSFWGDPVEATRFHPEIAADTAIRRLSCPAVLNAREAGAISAAIANKTRNPNKVTIQSYVSSPEFPDYRLISSPLSLKDRETQKIQFTVSQADLVNGHSILVRLFQFPNESYSTRTAACGILIIHHPTLTGNMLIGLVLVATFGLLASGLALTWIGLPPLTEKANRFSSAMWFLGGIVVLGLIATLLGWWVLAGIMLVLSVLLTLSLLPELLNSTP